MRTQDTRSRLDKLRDLAAPGSGATEAERENAKRLIEKLPRETKPRTLEEHDLWEKAYKEYLAYFAAFRVSVENGEFDPEIGYCAGYPYPMIRAFVASLKVGSHVSVFSCGSDVDKRSPLPSRREGVVARFTKTGIVVLEDGSKFRAATHQYAGFRCGETGREGWLTYLADPSWRWGFTR